MSQRHPVNAQFIFALVRNALSMVVMLPTVVEGLINYGSKYRHSQ